MTELLICAGVVIVFAFTMPMMVRSSKRSASRKTRAGAGSAAMGDALSGFFDPGKKVMVEQIEQRRETGNAAEGAIGEKLD